jgi:septal ring factor EnvC (AmiA/AmiB activator)
MQKKSIAMMLVAGCAVGMLTGCGIPEEEHNAIIAEMEAKFKAEEEKLNIKIAEQDSVITSEKTKVAQLESELKTSKSATAAAQDQAMEAENKFNTLDVEYQELKRRFEMFQKNMSALNQASKPAAPKAATQDDLGMLGEPAPAPKTDAQKASSLLDQMGNL